MSRRVGEISPDLIDILFETLLDLFAEELFQISVTKPVLTPLWEIRDEVGDQRARQATRLGIWIVRKERIDRGSRRGGGRG